VNAAKILMIGHARPKRTSFTVALSKRYEVFAANSGDQGLVLAKEHDPQVVILDAVSMRTPGERVCKTLRNALINTPIIHIHPGPKIEAQSAADIVLFDPFTARKLINCIERLVQPDDDEIISCGPFSMNVARRILTAHGQETQLTPKQALLIEIFLRHPFETLDRKTLMQKVWHTDYLGDTRTLDVHIRWIRKALEDNPDETRYLKTIRGVGYRLEIPDTLVPIVEPSLLLEV
jgi:DNA-binding response OmpR family regulator